MDGHKEVSMRQYTSISTTNDQALSSLTPVQTSEHPTTAYDYPKATPLPNVNLVPNLQYPADYAAINVRNIYRCCMGIIFRVWTSFPHESEKQYKWIGKNYFPGGKVGEKQFDRKLFLDKNMLLVWRVFKSLHGVQLEITGYRDIRPFEFYCFVSGIREIRLPLEAINTSTILSEGPEILNIRSMYDITQRKAQKNKNVLLETLITVYKLGQKYTEEELKMDENGVSQFTIAIKTLVPILEKIYAELEQISLNHGWPCWFEIILPYRKFSMKSKDIGFKIRKGINPFTVGEYYSFHPNEIEHQFPLDLNRRSEVSHKCFKKLAKFTCDLTNELSSRPVNDYFKQWDGKQPWPKSITVIIDKMKAQLKKDYNCSVDGVVAPPHDFTGCTDFPIYIRRYVKDTIGKSSSNVPNWYALWSDFLKESFQKEEHVKNMLELECTEFKFDIIYDDDTGEIDGIQTQEKISKGEKVTSFGGIITYIDHFERTAYNHNQKFGEKMLNITKRELVNYSIAIPFEDLPNLGFSKLDASSHSIAVTPYKHSCARYMVQNSDGFYMNEEGIYKKKKTNFLKNSNVYLTAQFKPCVALSDIRHYDLRAQRDIQPGEFMVINRRAGIDVTLQENGHREGTEMAM